MTWEEYAEFVTKFASTTSMASFKDKVGTGGLGLSGEAGEVAEIAKKVLYHGMDFTDEVRQKLVKELGDCMWYITFICRNVLNITLQDVIDANVQKLTDRYKNGVFSKEEFMKKENAKND